ncbi:MAG: tRNA (adenosine(37)-N6)-threonylcarbamoyltransferase complex dimerization subunit type 1 TsaB [Bacteroidota bacterium]
MSVPTLLALETSTDVCGVAVHHEGAVQASLSVFKPRAHAAHLLPLVQQALAVTGLTPADLNVVAVSAGPGSFTGLRIGVSAAKGLAQATGAALVAVPTLAALAWRGGSTRPDSHVVLVAQRARKDELYLGAYLSDPEHHALEPVWPARAIVVAEVGPLLQALPTVPVIVMGGGRALLAPALEHMDPPVQSLPDRLTYRASAEAVAVLGMQRFEAGLVESVSSFEPAYLKPFVAKKPSHSAFDRLPF